MKLFLLASIAGLGMSTFASILGDDRKVDIVLEKPSDPEPCLALIAKSIPGLLVSGKTLIEPSANGLTIFSGNGRSTFVAKEGNCGPVQRSRTSDTDKFGIYFSYLKQQKDNGIMPKVDYQRVIDACRNSSLPHIKASRFDIDDEKTGNAPPPAAAGK